MENVDLIGPLPNGSATVVPPLALIAWFFIALVLGTSGVLATTSGPPFGLGLAIALPVLLWAVGGRLWRPLSRALMTIQPATLVAVQAYRVVGVVFLVAWGRGLLPAGFALPAGIGDVTIGLTAPFVAGAIARRARGYRKLTRLWTILGLIDLVGAVGSGVLHARPGLGLGSTVVTTNALGVYPLSLIPTFLVPLAIILHLQALRATRAEP